MQQSYSSVWGARTETVVKLAVTCRMQQKYLSFQGGYCRFPCGRNKGFGSHSVNGTLECLLRLVIAWAFKAVVLWYHPVVFWVFTNLLTVLCVLVYATGAYCKWGMPNQYGSIGKKHFFWILFLSLPWTKGAVPFWKHTRDKFVFVALMTHWQS